LERPYIGGIPFFQALAAWYNLAANKLPLFWDKKKSNIHGIFLLISFRKNQPKLLPL